MEHTTNNATETKDLAKKIASLSKAGDILALYGDLGAGKTTFTQGFCLQLQVNNYVTSPTFTLINIYKGLIPVFHIDLYRLNELEDALDIGIKDYLPSQNGITIVEWADKFPELLPENYISIKISYENETSRKFTINKNGKTAVEFENHLAALINQ